MKLRLLSIFLFLLFIYNQVNAQQNSFKFHNITLKDGLSQSSVNTILQDKDGYMWFGTQDGLNRYDGYTFKIYQNNFSDSNSISNNFINFLFQDSKKYFWIGTNNGLNLYNPKNQTFKHFFTSRTQKRNTRLVGMCELNNNRYVLAENTLYKLAPGLKPHEISHSMLGNLPDFKGNAIVAWKNKLWIATENNGLLMFQPENRHFKQFTTISHQLKSNNITVLKVINDVLWLGFDNGAATYNINTGEFSVIPNFNYTVRSFFVDEQQRIWIGTENNGIFIKDSIGFTHIVSDPTNIYTLVDNTIFTIYKDKFGCVWIGTEHGISKFDVFKQFFRFFTFKENSRYSINSKTVWSLYYDDQTKITYVGTDKGLNVIYPDNHVDYFLPSHDNITKNSSIYSIQKTSNHKIICGTDRGLFLFENNRLSPIKTNSKTLNTDRVYYIKEDSKKQLWICGRTGLHKLVNGMAEYYSDSLLPKTTTRIIQEDKNGNYWIGTDANGLFYLNDNTKTVKQFTNSKQSYPRISNNTILSLLADDKYVWIGTFGGGLNCLNTQKNTTTYYTVNEGLPNNVIYGILKDNAGNLWMSTNKGISKFNIKNKTFTNYYESDGLQSNEFNTGAYFKSKSGLMFFGGINGFNSFNPQEIKSNPYPPKLVFTDFTVNNLKNKNDKIRINEAFQNKQVVSLKHNQNFITISFAALHYSAPEKNRYKYKLIPLNEDWVDLGNQHHVYLSNLEHGEYTLKVMAANADGVWTKKPIELQFHIAPPIWKTWWFRTLAGGLLILIVFLYYRSRIRMIKRQKELLEMQVIERTARIRKQKERIEKQKEELEQKQKELEIEKEKSEKLLLNILPEKTVAELKVKGKSKPRHYNQVSVMFADFKNFTRISENLRPEELVARLDSYFIKFDEIIEAHHVEKIKTMGDAYMCAGGVPIRNKTNPIDITLAALKIQQYMRQSNAKLPEKDRWYLRIGIHTGEVTAGVIGLKRFAYDIWGDTVNVASRVETSGEPEKVNISGQTYEYIKEFFECEYRGKIPAKNKGDIDMYFVNRIKPELSEDEDGVIPNKQFWNYANLHIFSQINYRKAEKYILKVLEKELPDNLYYHSLAHTIDVTEAVERLALMEQIDGEEIFLLKTAALYHDAGFIKQYDKNEPIGAQMAAEALQKFGYSDEQIKIIQDLILATAIPQQPKNKLEQIICDADLDYLGRDDFHPIADLLKKELVERGKITSDRQWDEIQVAFLSAHKYHTKSAIKLRREKKLKHLEEIKERLKKYQ